MSEPERAPIPVPRPPHAWFGKTIARCKVGDRIGRGATSHVFRATYQPLNMQIALKILAADRTLDAEMRSRFLGEAKAIARLDHENIVKVVDVVEDQKCLCILMEYVSGGTLQDLLDDEKMLPPKRALRIALQVARALDCAHEEDIVHRDIKPANVMLTKGSAAGIDLVKVVDFGLAARGAENRVGTPMFMSPEAAQGKRIDEKSDVYALGVCLYQCLTGKLPFGGASVKEILAAQVSQEAKPPSVARRGLGTTFDALLAKMLVKSKGYRPSAAEVAEDIEDLLEEPHAESAGRRRPRRRGAERRSAAPVAISIAAVVALGIVAAVLLKTGGEPPIATPPPPTTGGTGAGTSTSPPPVDPNAAAKASYDRAEAWAKARPEDFAGQAKEWAAAERDCTGTEWAAAAAAKRKAAEEAAAKKKAAEDEAERERLSRVAKDAEVAKMHEQVVTLGKACDFAGASQRAEKLGAPPGGSTLYWNKKVQRLRYLAEHFVPKMAERLKASPIPALKIRATAGADDLLTGATRSGLVIEKGGTIPWTEVAPKDLLDKVAKKVFSQSRPEDALFLAVLAAEIGLDQQAWMLSEQAGLVDSGTITDRLRECFPIAEKKPK